MRIPKMKLYTTRAMEKQRQTVDPKITNTRCAFTTLHHFFVFKLHKCVCLFFTNAKIEGNVQYRLKRLSLRGELLQLTGENKLGF